jgi:hypothetical protein
LTAIVRPRLSGDGRAWFEAAVAGEAVVDHEHFWLTFGQAPRRLGRVAVSLAGDERASLGALGLGHTLDGWRLDELVRVAWLLSAADVLAPGAFERLVEATWRRGDSLVARVVLKALPLLPRPERFLILALEGARSSLRLVFEALARDNAYPATYFHEVHFNQLVVRAVAADLPLDRIVGVRERVNPELVRLTRAHVALRRAAGRAVPAALDRFSAAAGGVA